MKRTCPKCKHEYDFFKCLNCGQILVPRKPSVRVTREQSLAVLNLWKRKAWVNESYRTFRRRFLKASKEEYLWGFCYGNTFGIEKDGYTHT